MRFRALRSSWVGSYWLRQRPSAPLWVISLVFSWHFLAFFAPCSLSFARCLQVINNKISNVCARGDGVSDSERISGAIAKALALPAGAAVLPSSTGVIGWKLPIDDLVAAAPVPPPIPGLQKFAHKAVINTEKK